MLEAARVAASIEMLAQCMSAWSAEKPLPADIIINRYFKARRYIGSKDRGAIAALCYQIIRNLALLAWHAEKQGVAGERPLVIAALLLMNGKTLRDVQNIFSGERFSPAKFAAPELAFAKAIAGKNAVQDEMPDYVRYNYPQWLETEIHSSLGESWQDEMAALAQEAPVDLRVNTLLTTREELVNALRKEGFEVTPTSLSPIGVRMQKRAPIFTSRYFKQGWFEMQDEGSQLVSLMLDAKPGQRIIDFCAGAGGKTLAIAAQMKNKGRILAWDTSQKRLDQMPQRLRRAKVDNVQIHVLASESDPFIKRHKGTADAVIVDAPCSGSGTWRRNPDLKWRIQPHDLEETRELQKRILYSAANLVKPGGCVLYVTCSILKCENENQVDAFMSHMKNFRVVTTGNLCSKFADRGKLSDGFLRLTPLQNSTDGFFASLLQRLE